MQHARLPNPSNCTWRSPRVCKLFPRTRAYAARFRMHWLVLAAIASVTAPALAQFNFSDGQDESFNDSRDKVKVTAVAASTEVAPGGDLPIAITFRIAPGWHIWPTETSAFPPNVLPFDGAIFTTLALPLVDGETLNAPGTELHLRFVQWPEVHGAKVDLGEGEQTYGVFEGSFTIYVPATISPECVEGARTLKLSASFQTCDDRSCLAPADVELEIPITIKRGAVSSALTSEFAGFDPSTFAKIHGGVAASEVIKFDVFGFEFTIDPNGSGFFLLLFVAALGGALLNLTPCVLPVIPLKIMGLAKSAGNNRGRMIFLSGVMSAGVIVFWMALGLMVASISGFSSTNQLFQYPLFTIGVGSIIAVMAIGMTGFFSVPLPQFLHSVESKQESVLGSFLFGIMTAILSTPCTAPLMGAAAAWAVLQPTNTVLIVFAAIGIGMSFPYLVLSAFPKLVSRMPRAGEASEVIKQSMGLLLLAAAVFFIGSGVSSWLVEPPDPPAKWYWWCVAAPAAAAGVWIVMRTFQITRAPMRRLGFGGLGVLIASVSLLIGASQTAKGPVDWIPYTPTRFEDALKAGDVVVMDFTAEWCLNCKALESTVLHSKAVAELLNSDGVTPIKVDITGNNEQGNAALKR
ncbi:MAG: DUF255 domain-containing protein, partial [Phycisphaerales bacterium]|nr:DUF255 domain-containing protein [Phycisphaerales bacterium]